jgi:hypothetical protein
MITKSSLESFLQTIEPLFLHQKRKILLYGKLKLKLKLLKNNSVIKLYKFALIIESIMSLLLFRMIPIL